MTPSTELPERIDLNEIGAATVSRHLCHDPGDSIPGSMPSRTPITLLS